MLVGLVAVEHILIHVRCGETLAAIGEDVFKQLLGCCLVFRKDIQRLHIHFGEQSFGSPFGGAEGLVMSLQQYGGFTQVVDDELPRLSDGGTALLERLDIGIDAVDDREAPRIFVYLEEDLRMPIGKSTVEQSLPAHIVERSEFALFG